MSDSGQIKREEFLQKLAGWGDIYFRIALLRADGEWHLHSMVVDHKCPKSILLPVTGLEPEFYDYKDVAFLRGMTDGNRLAFWVQKSLGSVTIKSEHIFFKLPPFSSPLNWYNIKSGRGWHFSNLSWAYTSYHWSPSSQQDFRLYNTGTLIAKSPSCSTFPDLKSALLYFLHEPLKDETYPPDPIQVTGILFRDAHPIWIKEVRTTPDSIQVFVDGDKTKCLLEVGKPPATKRIELVTPGEATFRFKGGAPPHFFVYILKNSDLMDSRELRPNVPGDSQLAALNSSMLSLSSEMGLAEVHAPMPVRSPGADIGTGSKLAILIAIEKYQPQGLRSVQFAENDAAELSATLEKLGFEKNNQHLLINEKATKTTIESLIRRSFQSVGTDDTIYMFYAGHGFSANEENYITCWDTQSADLRNTSVKLQDLFALIRSSECKRVILFLDSCGSGMVADASMRAIYDNFSEKEINEFFRDSEFNVCFASCKADEESYHWDKLSHGIWTYHLIRALAGEEPEALEKGRFITHSSLQNYLSKAVKRELRQMFTTPHVQTPWLYGAMSKEFIIADLTEILKVKKINPPSLKQVLLSSIEASAVKSLSGFKKESHFVPKYNNNSAAEFINSIAEDDLREDVEQVFQAVKEHLGYTRRDLKVSTEYGTATLTTPDFIYNVSVSLNPDDTSEVIWCREVTEIQKPEVIYGDGFDAVFSNTFDTIKVQLDKSLNLEEFIDRVEAGHHKGLQISYPENCSHCEITLEGFNGTFRVTAYSISIKPRDGSSPRALLKSVSNACQALAHKQITLPISPQSTEAQDDAQ